jgi:aminoglycoside phosphotransferase (APT) family kinase protein
MAMHEDQLHVSEDTVRRLVDEQFPRWKELALREVRTAGTVNAIFRIGDEFAASFLLRAQDPTQARADLTAESRRSLGASQRLHGAHPRAGRNR